MGYAILNRHICLVNKTLKMSSYSRKLSFSQFKLYFGSMTLYLYLYFYFAFLPTACCTLTSHVTAPFLSSLKKTPLLRKNIFCNINQKAY